MNCKHKEIKGNTTKYFYCNLFGKAIDDYRCKDCIMKLESKDNTVNKLFNEMFGGWK